MDTSFDTTGVTSEIPDNSVEQELLHVFYTEYKHLVEVYKLGLEEIMELGGNKRQGYKDIFRVFHTLKGDSAYFPEFATFTKFITEGCEDVRNVPEEYYNDQTLITKLNINFAKLSSIFFAADKMGDPSIAHFQAFLLSF